MYLNATKTDQIDTLNGQFSILAWLVLVDMLSSKVCFSAIESVGTPSSSQKPKGYCRRNLNCVNIIHQEIGGKVSNSMSCIGLAGEQY